MDRRKFVGTAEMSHAAAYYWKGKVPAAQKQEQGHQAGHINDPFLPYRRPLSLLYLNECNSLDAPVCTMSNFGG